MRVCFNIKKKVEKCAKWAYTGTMDFNSKEFAAYLEPEAPRADIIQNFLKDHGVDSVKTVIDGKNHILVQFPSKMYNPQFKIKTVCAHYDRVAGSPGANDNSAANWMLMDWAVSLASMERFHNVRIFFTDGEELGWNTGVNEQGAFGIASIFKRLGFTNDDVYVFDSCGRGEIPILARQTFPDNSSQTFLRNYNDLYERTQNILRRSCPGRWMSLPVPYSDNASFLACGIPAMAITMLPAQEAALYSRELLSDKNLENAVMNRAVSKKEREFSETPEYSYKERMPATWRMFHTQADNLSSLTPGSIRVMGNLLRTLAETVTPII